MCSTPPTASFPTGASSATSTATRRASRPARPRRPVTASFPAVRGDRQLVSVVLGAEKITLADGKSTLTKSFSETIRLFDYGFDCFSRREVVSADELVREVPVALSSEANYVVAHPAESITRMLPTELDLSELTRASRCRTAWTPPCRRRRAGRNDRLLQRHRLRHGQAARAQRCQPRGCWSPGATWRTSSPVPSSGIVLVVLLLLILAFLFLRGNGRGRRYGKRSSGRAAPAGYRGHRRR